MRDYIEIKSVPPSWTVYYEAYNDWNQRVALIAAKGSQWFGVIGVGSIIDDMQFLSSVPGTWFTRMFQVMVDGIQSMNDEL